MCGGWQRGEMAGGWGVCVTERSESPLTWSPFAHRTHDTKKRRIHGGANDGTRGARMRRHPSTPGGERAPEFPNPFSSSKKQVRYRLGPSWYTL